MLSIARAELFPLVDFPHAGILQLVPAGLRCSFPSSPSHYKHLFFEEDGASFTAKQHYKAVIN